MWIAMSISFDVMAARRSAARLGGGQVVAHEPDRDDEDGQCEAGNTEIHQAVASLLAGGDGLPP